MNKCFNPGRNATSSQLRRNLLSGSTLYRTHIGAGPYAATFLSEPITGLLLRSSYDEPSNRPWIRRGEAPSSQVRFGPVRELGSRRFCTMPSSRRKLTLAAAKLFSKFCGPGEAKEVSLSLRKARPNSTQAASRETSSLPSGGYQRRSRASH